MPLRVIGGSLGGRTLRGPPRTGVRPTAARVREALFEILTARGAPMRRVLDLYSGTGALGIEAMSRGAEHCDFVEADSKACEVIRDNLRRTGLLDRTKLWPMTVAKALPRLAGDGGNQAIGQSGSTAKQALLNQAAPQPHSNPLPPEGEGTSSGGGSGSSDAGVTRGYDLVLADPPYEYDRAEAELASVIAKGLLAAGGTLVVEHSQRKQWPRELAGLEQLTSRRYGDTRITLYIQAH
jgi:16S rRNA G966 N2-methylase RsmD